MFAGVFGYRQIGAATQALFAAMAGGEKAVVSKAAAQVTGELSRFYRVNPLSW